MFYDLSFCFWFGWSFDFFRVYIIVVFIVVGDFVGIVCNFLLFMFDV